jgi:2-methylcitrate dehydratase PrpD
MNQTNNLRVTEKLAGFVVNLDYEQFPAKAVEKAKEAFIDWLGVTFVGSREKMADIIVNYVREAGGNPKATVIGAGLKTSAGHAALIHGLFSHAVDYDDVSWPMIGHPSVTILPVVFALGEEYKISGKKALEAFIAGFEIETRLGLGTGQFHYHKGWHTTATIGTFGAAAAAAKILGLNATETKTAFGLAASHSAGLRQNFGTMAKPYHAGNAARSGLVAAVLARMGFTANQAIIESPLGFGQVFCGDFDAPAIIANLGDPLAIISPGREVKKYPSCGGTHTAIDAVLELGSEERISTDDIVSIECQVNEKALNVLIYHQPRTGLEGKFSMEYCLAVALLDKKVGLEQFTDERVQQPDVKRMISKITIVPKTNFNITPPEVIVTIFDHSGGKREKYIKEAKGSPGNPLSHEEIEEKFRDCAIFSGVLRKSEVERTLALLNSLESLNDLSSLVVFFAGEGKT